MGGGRLIPEDKIYEVRNAVDVVEVIGEYFPLKKAGHDRYRALCPFHSEKTPSFFVDGRLQIYKCFGCGKGGNVFTFLMEREGMSFPQAVEAMAERAGIEIPRLDQKNAGDTPVQSLYEAMEEAAAFYEKMLFENSAGKEALEYLLGRRKLSETISRRFKIGYSPNSWDALVNHLRSRKFTAEVLEKTALARKRQEGGGHVDYFRNRLMFPIRDSRGRIVAFGGRSLDGSEPKYLNSPDTALFQKSRILYGLDIAKDSILKENRAVVCEGYTDVMKCHEAGFTNAVAALGTAFGETHARTLSRYADSITVLFDSDEAGMKAADRSLEIFAGTDMDVSIVTLPGSKDPCDFLSDNTAEDFEKALAAGRDVFAYKMERVIAAEGGADAAKREKIADAMLELAAGITDPVRKATFLERLQRETGILRHTLEEKMRRTKKTAPRSEARGATDSAGNAAGRGNSVQRTPAAHDRIEWALLEHVFSEADPKKRAELTANAYALLNPRDYADKALGELLEEMAVYIEARHELVTADFISAVQGHACADIASAMLAAPEKPADVIEKEWQELAAAIDRRMIEREIEQARIAWLEALKRGDELQSRELNLRYMQLLSERSRLKKNVRGVRGGPN
jgi:DNA primase